VFVGVSVLVGVFVGVSVLVGVLVGVSVLVGVGVNVGSPEQSETIPVVPVESTSITNPPLA
jgi:hypothetical protein